MILLPRETNADRFGREARARELAFAEDALSTYGFTFTLVRRLARADRERSMPTER